MSDELTTLGILMTDKWNLRWEISLVTYGSRRKWRDE